MCVGYRVFGDDFVCGNYWVFSDDLVCVGYWLFGDDIVCVLVIGYLVMTLYVCWLLGIW